MAGGVLADVFKMELARKTRLQLQPSQPESLVALEMAFAQRKKPSLHYVGGLVVVNLFNSFKLRSIFAFLTRAYSQPEGRI